LEANSPAEQTSETESDRDNELAAQLDVPYESGYTERWFESSSVGLHGFIDLLLDQTTLVDYKTGSKSTPKNLIDAAAIEPVDEYPNFQALSYLAHQRTERPNERLRIHFVHLLHELDAAVSGSPPPVEDLITTVTYVPQTFSEFVSSRETFDELTDYADSNDRVKTLDAIGYDRFQKFFESHALPPAGEAPEQRQQVIEDFKSMATSTVGSYAYVTNGCELIFSDLEKPPAGYVLESDLDAFEAFVDDQLDALASYRADRFPVAFRDDGPTWDRVTYRDLILTDR